MVWAPKILGHGPPMDLTCMKFCLIFPPPRTKILATPLVRGIVRYAQNHVRLITQLRSYVISHWGFRNCATRNCAIRLCPPFSRVSCNSSPSGRSSLKNKSWCRTYSIWCSRRWCGPVEAWWTRSIELRQALRSLRLPVSTSGTNAGSTLDAL